MRKRTHFANQLFLLATTFVISQHVYANKPQTNLAVVMGRGFLD